MCTVLLFTRNDRENPRRIVAYGQESKQTNASGRRRRRRRRNGQNDDNHQPACISYVRSVAILGWGQGAQPPPPKKKNLVQALNFFWF